MIEKLFAERILGFLASRFLIEFLPAGADVIEQFLILNVPFFEAFRFTFGLVVFFEEGVEFQQQILA